MKRTLIIHIAAVGAVLSVATPLAAQSTGSRSVWDLTLGTSGKVSSASASWVVFTPRTVLDRVRFGLGIRATGVGGDLTLTPRGAKQVPAGVIDTLYLSSAAAMLNVSGHIDARLTDRLSAGFNIDLIGVGGGSERTGRYHASRTTVDQSVQASPTSNNIFLYGSKDRGSLNSEFYASWQVNDRITLRGGLSHQLVEYRATRVLASNTDYFRQYRNLGFVGLRIAR